MEQYNPFSVSRAARLERNEKSKKGGEKHGKAEKSVVQMDRPLQE